MNVTTFYTRGTKFFTTLNYILDELETVAIRAFFDCINLALATLIRFSEM